VCNKLAEKLNLSLGNPFMPAVSALRAISSLRGLRPRDAVSRTANVERNEGHKWVDSNQSRTKITLFQFNLAPNGILFGVLNQSKKCNYNLNLVWIYKIPARLICVQRAIIFSPFSLTAVEDTKELNLFCNLRYENNSAVS